MHKLMIFLLVGFFGLQIEGAHFVTGTVTSKTDGEALPGVNVQVKGSTRGTVTDLNGFYAIEVPHEKSVLVFTFIGLVAEEIKVKGRKIINVAMESDEVELQEVVVMAYGKSDRSRRKKASRKAAASPGQPMHDMSYMRSHMVSPIYEATPDFNTEGYSTIHENGFLKPLDQALSTFSIDVDAASYSNMRRFLNYGNMPPKDAVRIEEMVNYFTYDYEQPTAEDPFAIHSEISPAPWNEDHLMVHVGLQGKSIETDELPASNLVFLVDVSGSMQAPNKLPLLKASLKMLVNEMRPQDRVAMVVYAGAAGMVLPSTSGADKKGIIEALDNLSAGGSTAGGEGIELAYATAQKYFVKGGNNRIILATDGDFNVGASSNAAMERLIEKKREEGVFLTVLGFGMGNYKDDKMETLADKGNGNYAYIDNIREAKKVLVNEFGSTLFTIAKDVKIQVEFNPAKVQAYRLIGYENRLLAAEDFNDDQKDAGELGAGHTVTALYEIIPVGVESSFLGSVDPLKYQKKVPNSTKVNTNEWLTVKFRYKQPDSNKSKLIERTLTGAAVRMSDNLQWASAVAGFGMLLRDSDYKGDLTYDQVIAQARSAVGKDEFGYRREFLDLVETASALQNTLSVRSE
ncbi:MAG: von Willebrand factor type A domain-containing protein [Cytophagales bacterium]|nr:von Willebrand factor type A domain-containing protein [Cytophagales bacterium]